MNRGGGAKAGRGVRKPLGLEVHEEIGGGIINLKP